MVVRLYAPWIGGTERQAHNLARALAGRGIAVGVVTGWWFRGTAQRETLDGIPVFRNQTLWEFFGIKGFRKFGGYLYIVTLLWFLWRHRAEYDVVHVHGLNYHTFTAVLARRFTRKPVIVKLANSGRASDLDKMRHNRQLALARYMLPTALRCNRFIALNDAIAQELEEAGIPVSKIERLSNGVEVDRIRQKISYQQSPPIRIVFVGRLHRQKGLDVLLDAVALLIHRGHDIQVRLIGDGPHRSFLEAQAARLGISAQVVFAGAVDDAAALLADCDVFVLPSQAEGLSNALLEAMASALPVIVSDVPGNVDVIRSGDNGLVFAAGDSAELADAIADLINEPDLGERLGQKARQDVERVYSLDSLAAAYLDIYGDLVGRTRTADGRQGE